VHVVHRSPPLAVTSVDSCWQYRCTPKLLPTPPLGYALPVRNVKVNLDKPGSNLPVSSGYPEFLPENHYQFPFTVTRTDDEYFRLAVHSSRCTCKFVVYVYWEQQGSRHGKQIFDNNGVPFEVVAHTISHRYCYDSGDERGYAAISHIRSVRRVCEKQRNRGFPPLHDGSRKPQPRIAN
jgi:hypothetical protein